MIWLPQPLNKDCFYMRETQQSHHNGTTYQTVRCKQLMAKCSGLQRCIKEPQRAPIPIKHTTFILPPLNLTSNENSFINLQKYSVLRSLWRGQKKKKKNPTRQRMFCLVIWKSSTLGLTDFRALFNEWRGVQAFCLHEWIDPIKEITPISC